MHACEHRTRRRVEAHIRVRLESTAASGHNRRPSEGHARQVGDPPYQRSGSAPGNRDRRTASPAVVRDSGVRSRQHVPTARQPVGPARDRPRSAWARWPNVSDGARRRPAGTFADAWRARYHPAHAGRPRTAARDFVPLDVLHLENLRAVLAEYGLPTSFPPADLWQLTTAWHRLDPVAGQRRRPDRDQADSTSSVRCPTATSRCWSTWPSGRACRGTSSSAADVARVLQAAARGVHRRAADLLGLPPSAVMLVAAHNGDLAAARAAGVWPRRSCCGDRARPAPERRTWLRRPIGTSPGRRSATSPQQLTTRQLTSTQATSHPAGRTLPPRDARLLLVPAQTAGTPTAQHAHRREPAHPWSPPSNA